MTTRYPEASLLMPSPAASESRGALTRRLQAQQQSDTPAGGWLRGLLARMAEGLNRRRAMAELRELSDRELADIGLTRSEIPFIFAASATQAEAAAVAPAAPRATSPKAANDLAGIRAAA
ncbi:DUF1127 domain-containing protein [Roseomonas sp. BN140053]|uniref:DUF1127 domain-containing protein n=1 Tax=Roseomonas sp. BN140053 TaxID=3391898 RepID=UPI0039E8CFAD